FTAKDFDLAPHGVRGASCPARVGVAAIRSGEVIDRCWSEENGTAATAALLAGEPMVGIDDVVVGSGVCRASRSSWPTSYRSPCRPLSPVEILVSPFSIVIGRFFWRRELSRQHADVDDRECRLTCTEIWRVALLAGAGVLLLMGTGATELLLMH